MASNSLDRDLVTDQLLSPDPGAVETVTLPEHHLDHAKRDLLRSIGETISAVWKMVFASQNDPTSSHEPTLNQPTHVRSHQIPIFTGTRRALFAATGLAIAAVACKRKEAPVPPSPPPAPPAPPKDPNRPEFLDEDNVKLTGLTLMMSNNDIFDRYIFNAITGNSSFTNVYRIQKGYNLEFEDGRIYEMPYHAFIFKPFDKRSNINLPSRLGKTNGNRSLAHFFNTVTRYNANNAKDLAAIRTILVASYELSFGIKLDPNFIVVQSRGAKIETIKYTAPNAQQISATTVIAGKTQPDRDDPERRNLVSTDDKTFKLVTSKGELLFPPSVMLEQGLAIPASALPEKKQVNFSRKFQSQGREISVNIDIDIAKILEDQEKLAKQGRPRQYMIDSNTVMDNFGYYILKDDWVVKKLAQAICRQFATPREKMQAILDFVHSFNYVPDAYGESPRTPRISLICNGGDCEDSSILAVALAREVGIDCIFLHYNRHVMPACDIGEEGSATTWNGKKYEFMETTGGMQAVKTETTIVDQYGQFVRKDVDARPWKIGENYPDAGAIQFITHPDVNEIIRIR